MTELDQGVVEENCEGQSEMSAAVAESGIVDENREPSAAAAAESLVADGESSHNDQMPLREYCYGLGEMVPADGVEAVESNVGAPLTLLAYRVEYKIARPGSSSFFDRSHILEAIKYAGARLQAALAETCVLVSLSNASGEPLGPSLLDCRITKLWERSEMIVLFPNIVVVNHGGTLPQTLRAQKDCEDLVATPLSGVVHNSSEPRVSFTLGYGVGAELVYCKFKKMPSLRPTRKQWRRFFTHRERVQARDLATRVDSNGRAMAAAMPTFIEDSNGVALLLCSVDAPGFAVNADGEVVKLGEQT